MSKADTIRTSDLMCFLMFVWDCGCVKHTRPTLFCFLEGVWRELRLFIVEVKCTATEENHD